MSGGTSLKATPGAPSKLRRFSISLILNLTVSTSGNSKEGVLHFLEIFRVIKIFHIRWGYVKSEVRTIIFQVVVEGELCEEGRKERKGKEIKGKKEKKRKENQYDTLPHNMHHAPSDMSVFSKSEVSYDQQRATFLIV